MSTPAMQMGFASFVPNAVPFYEMRAPLVIRRRKLVKQAVVKKSKRRKNSL